MKVMILELELEDKREEELEILEEEDRLLLDERGGRQVKSDPHTSAAQHDLPVPPAHD
jgi:hypothetical protein